MHEIRRVLKPGGLLYISEPIFAGEFNEILRLFHDEQKVREAAFNTIKKVVDGGLFNLVEETFFNSPMKSALRMRNMPNDFANQVFTIDSSKLSTIYTFGMRAGQIEILIFPLIMAEFFDHNAVLLVLEDEHIPHFFCRLEILDMAGMHEVKATMAMNHFFALSF